MMNKKQVFAAVALMALAMTTIAYANLVLSAVTVTTEEAVTVSSITGTFPARSAGARTYADKVTLDFTKGGFAADDSVLVRVELVVDDPDIYKGFKSLVLQVKEGDVVETTLTLNTPYGVFTETVGDPVAAKNYDVKIIFATDKEALTDVAFKLSASIIGFGP
jgi:hypothetical protein